MWWFLSAVMSIPGLFLFFHFGGEGAHEAALPAGIIWVIFFGACLFAGLEDLERKEQLRRSK